MNLRCTAIEFAVLVERLTRRMVTPVSSAGMVLQACHSVGATCDDRLQNCRFRCLKCQIQAPEIAWYTGSVSLVDRSIGSSINSLIDEEPVVIVQGPRACGKTTLVQQLCTQRDRDLLDVGQPSEFVVASQDPAAYLAGRDEPVFIDEFQRVPNLLAVIKKSVDRTPRVGAFVLTGSTTQDLLPKGTETLAGRSAVTTMWGFSQGELLGVRERFIDRLFDSPTELMDHRSTLLRPDYAKAVATGGFPEAIRRTRVDAKRRWQLEYAARVADRDLAELVQIRRPGVFRSVLELSAARTSDVTNINKMSSDLGAGREAVNGYIELLERVFLLRRLRVYSRNVGVRVTSHPKLHVTDSGLATALSRLDENTIGRDVHFGHLLESFVVAEIVKQLGWSQSRCEPWFFRDQEANEVDLVLERQDGLLVGIEVKAGVTVGPPEAKGLRTLRAAVGERFVHGVVLYTGTGSFRIDNDPQISAHPVSTLWAN